MTRSPSLYVCRHAEAVDFDTAGGIDENRWLTSRGRRNALAMGRSLRERGERPVCLVSSPHVRAVQTAELIGQGLEVDPSRAVLRELALDRPLGPLLSRLSSLISEHGSVMLVGHEPQMSGLGALLLGRRPERSWPTCGVMRVDFDGDLEPGKGREVFFLAP